MEIDTHTLSLSPKHSGISGEREQKISVLPKLSSNNNDMCLMLYVCIYVTCMNGTHNVLIFQCNKSKHMLGAYIGLS